MVNAQEPTRGTYCYCQLCVEKKVTKIKVTGYGPMADKTRGLSET